MTLYLIYIVMTLVLAILYDGREECCRKRIWYGLTCIFLILLAGLRNGVGGDTLFYKKEYEDLLFTSNSGIAEYIRENLFIHGRMPLWSLFLMGCRKLSASFYFFQFIHAIIVIVPFFYIFKKYTNCCFLCALLYGLGGYFFLFNTEVLRESIAIVFCIIAAEYFFRGNAIGYIGYAVFATIGIMFHISACAVLLFPLARFIPIRFNTIIYGLIAAFVIWLAGDFIISHLPSSIALSDSSLARKVTTYSNQKSNFLGFLFNSMRYLCLPYVVMYYSLSHEKDTTLRKHKELFTAYLLLIGVCASSMTGLYRINNYTAIYYIAALSEFILLYIQSPRYFFLTKTTVLASSLYCIALFYTGFYPETQRHHYEFYYPYTSVFDDDCTYSFRYDMHDESTSQRKGGRLTRTD